MNVDGSIFTFKAGGTLTFKYDKSSLPKAMGSISKLTIVTGYSAFIGKRNISKGQEELLM